MSIRIDNAADNLFGTTNLPSITSFTIMVWAKWLGVGTWDLVINFGQNASGLYYGIGTRGDIGSNFFLTSPIGTVADAGFGPVIGRWYHLCITVAGTGTGQFKGYIDGVLVMTADGHASPTNARLSIGNNPDSDWLDGDVFSVKIWNRVLTDAEVQSEMWSVLPMSAVGLNRILPLWNAADAPADYAFGRNFSTAGTLTSIADNPPGVTWGGTRRKIYLPTEVAAGGGSGTTQSGSFDIVSLFRTSNVTNVLKNSDFGILSNYITNGQALNAIWLNPTITHIYNDSNTIKQSGSASLSIQNEYKTSNIIYNSQSGSLNITNEFKILNNINKSSTLNLIANQSFTDNISSAVAQLSSFSLYQRLQFGGVGGVSMSGGFEANPSGDTGTEAQVLRNADFDIVSTFNDNLSVGNAQLAQVGATTVFNTLGAFASSGAVAIDFRIYESFNANMNASGAYKALTSINQSFNDTLVGSGAYKGSTNIVESFNTQGQARNAIGPTLNSNFTLVDTILSSVSKGVGFDIANVYQDIFVARMALGGSIGLHNVYNNSLDANILGQTSIDFGISHKYGASFNANVAYKLQAVLENVYKTALDTSVNAGSQISFGLSSQHVTQLAMAKISPLSFGATLVNNDSMQASNNLAGSFIVVSKSTLESSLRKVIGLDFDLSQAFKTASQTVNVTHIAAFDVGNKYQLAVSFYEPSEVVFTPITIVTLLLPLDKDQFFELSID